MTQIEKEEALYLLKKEFTAKIEPLTREIVACQTQIDEQKQRISAIAQQKRDLKEDYAAERHRICQMPVSEGVWAKAKRIFQSQFQNGVVMAAGACAAVHNATKAEEMEQ